MNPAAAGRTKNSLGLPVFEGEKDPLNPLLHQTAALFYSALTPPGSDVTFFVAHIEDAFFVSHRNRGGEGK